MTTIEFGSIRTSHSPSLFFEIEGLEKGTTFTIILCPSIAHPEVPHPGYFIPFGLHTFSMLHIWPKDSRDTTMTARDRLGRKIWPKEAEGDIDS
jgi:hypothetical protein